MYGDIHMESLVVVFLSFAEIFFSGAHSTTFTFRNNCPYTIWPATLTGDGHPQLPSTGFELASQAKKSLDVPASWSGRLWARSLCSIDATGKFVCETADCASGQIECNGAAAIPPASLAEFTLGGYGGKDFYDISLVDGFNLPISVAPQGPGGCKSTTCPIDLNAKCPEELEVKAISGSVVACKSACLQFQQPQYCCTGDYGTPETCPPTSYAKFFKNLCPQAYSYAFDDKSSTFTCPTGVNYLVTICP